MQQLSLFIFLIAFVPRLAVAQPVLSTHPPVHTLAMTGKNAITGDMTIKALHFCQSTGQMEETDYDNNSDTWSAPMPASGIGPLDQVGQQPFSMAGFGSGTYPIYWALFDLALLDTIESSYGIATPQAIWHFQNGQPSPVPSKNMLPMSTVAYVDPDSVQRSNVFGLSSDGQNLLEGWLYRNAWNYWNHGNPGTYFWGSAASLFMTPGSAVVGGGAWGYPDEFVFVTGVKPRAVPVMTPDDFARIHVFAAYDYTNYGWSWQDLGSPNQTLCMTDDANDNQLYACEEEVGAPVGVIHPWQGSTRVHVFVPLHADNGQWQMWEDYADRQPDGSYHWNGWGNKGPLPPSVGDGVPFTLTQAVVWYFNSTVRIDVFGVTEDSQSGCPGNFIFDYRWDGQGWSTMPVGRSPSGCTHIQTTSAVVFPTPGGGSRLSVYAEDANGAIWEFVSWNGGSWHSTGMFVGSCF